MLNSVAMGWPIRLAWSLLLISQFFPVWYSSYALLFLLLVLGYHSKQLNWRGALASRWWHLWAVYFSWQLLSMSWTSNLTDGWSNLSTQLVLLLLPFLFLLRPPGLNDVIWLFKTHILASLGAMLYAVFAACMRLQALTDFDGYAIAYNLSYTVLAAPVMHPGYFSLNLVISMAICFYLVYIKTWRWQITTISFMGFTAVFLVMLNGRMTLFAAFITLSLGLVFFAIRAKRLKPILLLLVLAVGLLGTLPFLPPTVKGRLMEVTEGLSYDMATYQAADYNGISIRLALWECAGEVIHDNYLLGTGAGDGKDELRAVYAKKGLQIAIDDQLNSHNQFVENMVYGGLVQLVLLFFIFVWAWRKAYLNQNWLWAAFMLFVFLCLQTETILFWHRGVLFFGIFATLFYLTPRRGKFEEREV